MAPSATVSVLRIVSTEYALLIGCKKCSNPLQQNVVSLRLVSTLRRRHNARAFRRSTLHRARWLLDFPSFRSIFQRVEPGEGCQRDSVEFVLVTRALLLLCAQRGTLEPGTVEKLKVRWGQGRLVGFDYNQSKSWELYPFTIGVIVIKIL